MKLTKMQVRAYTFSVGLLLGAGTFVAANKGNSFNSMAMNHTSLKPETYTGASIGFPTRLTSVIEAKKK